MNYGLLSTIRARWARRGSERDEGLLGLDFIMAEIRRARRFSVPFSLAYFSPIEHLAVLTPQELADRIYPELREFDYVALDEHGTFIALWMFGTPRDGAQVKALRLKASPALSDLIAHAACGVATFPVDGLTYEALMATAQAEAVASQPQPAEHSVSDGAIRWQPSLPNTSS